jgi:glutathione peroxidase
MDTKASIYDIPLSSIEGEEEVLSKYKGKVTMIVNVTADCGNSPQYETLEEIYQKYKDLGFEILAVPTNDFCGPGITYNEFAEDGISCAADAEKYATNKYQVTFPFSEIVTSVPHETWREKRNNRAESHELYKTLVEVSGGEPMGGNFEKFLVDRDGKLVKRFHNYMLLDYYKDNVEAGITEVMHEQEVPPLSKEEAYEYICSEIEKLLK